MSLCPAEMEFKLQEDISYLICISHWCCIVKVKGRLRWTKAKSQHGCLLKIDSQKDREKERKVKNRHSTEILSWLFKVISVGRRFINVHRFKLSMITKTCDVRTVACVNKWGWGVKRHYLHAYPFREHPALSPNFSDPFLIFLPFTPNNRRIIMTVYSLPLNFYI